VTDKPTKQKEPFAYLAAKLSWIAPLVVMGLNYLNRTASRDRDAIDPQTQRQDALVLANLSMLIILTGLGLAIFALLSMKKHGRERIYNNAKAGLIVNSLMLTIAIIAIALAMIL